MSGRKRHILVDTTGLLLKAVVHPADVQDRDGARRLLTGLTVSFPRVAKLWADAGYQGPWARGLRTTMGWEVEIVGQQPKRIWWPRDQEPPPLPVGFQVLPRRWVVERTFAWLGRYRRLSKDYEVLPATEEAWLYLGMSRLMLARLAT